MKSLAPPVLLLAFAGSISLMLLLSLSNAGSKEENMEPMHVNTIDLTKYPATKPEKPVNLLFIHHSCGGQLFADKGPDVGDHCIYKTHPNGGGLRRMLEENNYIVHEASYGSLIGEDTDICHWHKKFKNYMDKILTLKHQDEFFTDGTQNQVVMFKSCFPNSWIGSDGSEPGDPDSCKKTLANYKAAYNSLLPIFSKYPHTLFIAVTAPPLAKPTLYKKEKLKEFIKQILGRPDTTDKVGRRVRAFNNWLKDVRNGWLKDYKLKNVVVFDYYDVLTGHGQSNWSMYPTGGGKDSHPSAAGNTKAAQEFVPFINRAVHRAGIS